MQAAGKAPETGGGKTGPQTTQTTQKRNGGKERGPNPARNRVGDMNPENPLSGPWAGRGAVARHALGRQESRSVLDCERFAAAMDGMAV